MVIMFRSVVRDQWLPTVLALSLVFGLASAGLAAENLVRNGLFDQDDLGEFMFRPLRDAQDSSVLDSHAGIFTEDLTWNRCYRIDLDRYVTDKNGRKMIHAQLAIGGAKGYDFHRANEAIEVEPETTYEFSLEMRGTVNKVGVSPIFYRGDAEGYDAIDSTGRTSLGRVTIGPDWTVYRGTFTTHADSERAVLQLSVYTHERYGLTEQPGTHLLIDNIKIHKKNAVSLDEPLTTQQPAVPPRAAAAPLTDQPPQVDGRLDEAAWQAATWQKGFRQLDQDVPAQVQTRYKVLAGSNALYVGIACQEPTPDRMRLEVTEDGGSAYSDDSIELFVDTGSEVRPLRQFIVNANGVRMMTWGQGQDRPSPEHYEGWSAEVDRSEQGWTVEVALPYTTLGLEAPSDAGRTVRFNLCRNRHAGEAPEHSSWAFARGNFHDRSRFGVLALGALTTDLQRRISQVEQRITTAASDDGADPAAWADLREALDALATRVEASPTTTESQWQEAYVKLAQLEAQARFLRVGRQPFVVTQVSPNATFTAPFLPEALVPTAEPMALHAAVNEFESLPVAITNLTDRVETYRVVLMGAVDNGIEVEGLANESGQEFPAAQIATYEAVRVKDSDEGEPGQRFDALAPMGIARTVVVPPKASGLVWFTFDCRGITPGEYEGTLRVIPLSEPASFKLERGWQYHGPKQDIPVSLAVWPITLPREAVMPTWLMDDAPNKAFFRHMIEHGDSLFQVSPWHFVAEFDEQGQLTESDTERVQSELRRYQRWTEELGLVDPPHFLVGFSSYRTFYKQHLDERFEVGSPQWERALGAWMRLIEQTFEKSGVPRDRYIVELWDEPHREDQAEVLASLRVAKEACPELPLTITLGASRQTPEQIFAMAEYADEFCFWGTYWNDSTYVEAIQALREQGKGIWFYYCDTNLRVNLYRYYRLHAWKAWDREVDGMGLFSYMSGPGGFYGRSSWKTTPPGSLAYNASNQPITTIRLEVLREGMDDVKYLRVLKETLQDASEADPAVIEAARAFLASVPSQVVGRLSHQRDQAERARREAAELILQLRGTTSASR